MTARQARRAEPAAMSARVLRGVGILLMASAAALAISRAPDRPVQSLVARWAPQPSDFIELRGQLVHLRDEGPRTDPLPVVLLHGMSSSLHTWEGWAAGLRGQRRVITLDLPGFGLTGPNAGADYRPDRDARFVLELLDALGVPRFVVGGNALGGEVAWRIAGLAPARVERLILVDAAGYPPHTPPLGLRLAALPVLGKALEWVLPREFVTAALREVYGDPARITPALVDRYFELTLREGNRHALRQRIRQDGRGDESVRIAALRLPTLILWGGRDRLLAPAQAERFRADIAGSALVVFDDLGHVPQEEDPARTLAPVKTFLGLR